jgi:acyl carrier protein
LQQSNDCRRRSRCDTRRNPEQVSGALTSVAPEIDPASLNPSAPLRSQVDLDSMDFLRFIVELHKRLGVAVSEADYAKLTSLDAIADYVASGH